VSTIEPFRTEADALARLDELNHQRQEAKAAEQAVLQEIKDTLRVAGAQPFDRSRLIEHSGLSRRTAYLVLPPKPAD
jgi:hypothetical protein